MRTRPEAETRARLVAAATTLFRRKGFQAATMAEICADGETNIAAVNYHFGDKESLYRAVWEHLTELAITRYPGSGGIPENAAEEERLRGHIVALVRRRTDPELETFHRLHLHEYIQTTGLVNDILLLLRSQHAHLHSALGDLLGPGATEGLIEQLSLPDR